MKPPLESWLIPIVVIAALASSCGPKKQPETKQAVAAGSARADVESNLSALEYFGDTALTEERPADAVSVFVVLAMVHPDKPDLVEKATTAKKKNAVALTDIADAQYHRDLPGAALVTELRALQ